MHCSSDGHRLLSMVSMHVTNKAFAASYRLLALAVPDVPFAHSSAHVTFGHLYPRYLHAAVSGLAAARGFASACGFE